MVSSVRLDILYHEPLPVMEVLMKFSTLTRLQDDGLIDVIDLGPDHNRPKIPSGLEEMFMVHGRHIFLWLIERAGGRMKAERIAKISSATMSRWLNAEPGSLFGQGGKMRNYRSIWFGYPSPYPGFDRIVEEIDPDKSFLSICVERYGMIRTMAWMRDPYGFGLEMLELPFEDLRDAANIVGIPAATRRRWTSGVSYPTQWRSLDRLCRRVVGLSWFETVLYVRPRPTPRTVSNEALRCLIDSSLQAHQ